MYFSKQMEKKRPPDYRPLFPARFSFLRHIVSYMHECLGIYYINTYGNEIHPYPNPDFLTNVSSRQVLVYSCGSLWTRSVTLGRPRSSADLKYHSIMPCLALRGVARGIAKSHSLKAKVLLRES